MSKAHRNPLGFSAPAGTRIVRVGQGEHTHIFDPLEHTTLCRSGRHRTPESQVLRNSKAKFATCYRCVKLASINVEEGREPWRSA